MFTDDDPDSQAMHDYSEPLPPQVPSSPLKQVAFRTNKEADLIREVTGFDENEFKERVRKSYNELYHKLKGTANANIRCI